MKSWLLLCLMVVLLPGAGRAYAQAGEGVMSEAEVETLRDSAYVPLDRIVAYEKILDSRQKRIEDLVAKRRRPGFELDLHELFDQFAAIEDEFLDNLDEYRKRNRDVRKVLPKLVLQADRWQKALDSPPQSEAYKIVRKLALDNLNDLRETAKTMQTEQEAYFKAHPEAAKAEKDRIGDEHAPRSETRPR